MKFKLLIAAAALSFAGAAQAGMVTASNPQSVIDALQSGGYKAVLGKDGTGDPRIESAASGAKFIITFYGCTANRDCKTVTFYAGWRSSNTSMSQMNDWNKAKRFSRAYIDKDGDPVMEFDVDLDDGGMSEALFIDNVQFFEAAMGAFKKHIGIG